MERRWLVCKDEKVLGTYFYSDLPELPEGSYAMQLPISDDGVSDWYFHEKHGWVMEGAELPED